MNLKNGKVFTSKFFWDRALVLWKKKNYQAAVSQRLRNTALDCSSYMFCLQYGCPQGGFQRRNAAVIVLLLLPSTRNVEAESSDETSGIYPPNVTASYTRMP